MAGSNPGAGAVSAATPANASVAGARPPRTIAIVGGVQGIHAAPGDYLPRQVQRAAAGQRTHDDRRRHRVPAGPLAAVRSLERLGVLEVHTGRVESMRMLEHSVEVTWRPRGAARPPAWLVDRVVNCTGPDMRVTRSPDPLVQSLLAAGLIRADSHGLGIDVAADGRVLSRAGTPVDSLYYLGPWLRTRDWEATAVPELREQAVGLARRLVTDLAKSRGRPA